MKQRDQGGQGEGQQSFEWQVLLKVLEQQIRGRRGEVGGEKEEGEGDWR